MELKPRTPSWREMFANLRDSVQTGDLVEDMHSQQPMECFDAAKVEDRIMMNLESEVENDPYLKLMQKDKPPTSGTYAIVEDLWSRGIYGTYAVVERNVADIGLKKAAASSNLREEHKSCKRVE